jgi:hypothetical protein
MKNFLIAAVVLVLLGLANAAHAANPTGLWTWVGDINGQNHPCSLKLRLDSEGSVLSGFYFDDQYQQGIAIQPAVFYHEDPKINFVVTREFQGQKCSLRCVGTFNGDFISGVMYVETGSDVKSTNWLARRQPEPAR